MADRYSPWPTTTPWLESQRATTAGGPDFPDAPGDREKGRFRPSRTPRLTTIAVVNDDGTAIGERNATVEEETVMLLRGILFGLSVLVDIPVEDLLNAGNSA